MRLKLGNIFGAHWVITPRKGVVGWVREGVAPSTGPLPMVRDVSPRKRLKLYIQNLTWTWGTTCGEAKPHFQIFFSFFSYWNRYSTIFWRIKNSRSTRQMCCYAQLLRELDMPPCPHAVFRPSPVPTSSHHLRHRSNPTSCFGFVNNTWHISQYCFTDVC